MELNSKDKARIKHAYGPWAVVTGASSGIGKELATQLAKAGLNLVIVARSADKLQVLKEQLELRNGIKVMALALDLAEAVPRQVLIDQTHALEVGLLVASAGFGTSGNFIQSSAAAEVNMLQVNCEALLVLTHHYAQRFARQKRGGIILMSSMVGFQGVPYAAHYAATKAYVQSLGEALAVELQPNGIDVLAAAPGPVASGFASRANMQMDMTLTPQQIGVPILRALGRRQTLLPGRLTKLLVYSLRTVPRWAKIRIMQKVMGGMTQHQRAV